ncbi:MAG: methionine biosynthesis protein MetW [Burkholderiales bacterium]|nr:methionine biosynthesis protein MetW [Burkholderiales bacterium]
MTREDDNFATSASRPDFAAIAGWVKPGAKVLDLGCGDGSLLRYLNKTRKTRGYGVEISDENILACTKNDVNVLQNDLETGLSGFESNSFDYVILSQTLQAMRHSERIMNEMLRVGREAIVTFPNFGYWRHRLELLNGRMPVSGALPYQWFDTPNIHLCTIADFEKFCRDYGMRILERVIMNSSDIIRVLPNWRGTLAVYRVERETSLRDIKAP